MRWAIPLVAAATLAGACRAGGPARLETETTVLGRDAAGERTVRVRVRNGGARALLVHAALPGCGCRLGTTPPDVLPAGAAGVLLLRCQPPAEGAPPPSVRLLTSDPARRDVVVPLPLEAARAPASVYFGYVAVGESAAREVALSDPPADAAAVLRPAGGPFSVERSPTGAVTYRVRFAPRAPGAARAALVVGDVTVALRGVGAAGLVAFPPEVSPNAERALGGAREVVLKNLADAPVDVTRIEYPPGLQGELVTDTPGRQMRLRLRGRVGAGVPVGAAAIRIHTSLAAQPLLTIPVRDPAGRDG